MHVGAVLRSVGRDDELERLRRLYEEVHTEREPRFVALVGPPGSGARQLVDRDQAIDELARTTPWRSDERNEAWLALRVHLFVQAAEPLQLVVPAHAPKHRSHVHSLR